MRFKSFLRYSDRSPHITGGGKSYGNAGRVEQVATIQSLSGMLISRDVGYISRKNASVYFIELYIVFNVLSRHDRTKAKSVKNIEET